MRLKAVLATAALILGTTAQARPGTVGPVQPGTTAQTRPAITAQARPGTTAQARAPAHGRRARHRHHRPRTGALALAARIASRGAARSVLQLQLTRAAAPPRASLLSAVLPPGVLALVTAAAARTDAPPAATDGLASRELRRGDDSSGTRIMPLAIGRF